eukprot:9532318-Prorocentrum_lima.AAC.1
MSSATHPFAVRFWQNCRNTLASPPPQRVAAQTVQGWSHLIPLLCGRCLCLHQRLKTPPFWLP